jgi:hypothetical protein
MLRRSNTVQQGGQALVKEYGNEKGQSSIPSKNPNETNLQELFLKIPFQKNE